MDLNKHLVCPECKGVYFEMKREATFLYSYKINTPLTGEWSKKDDKLPFLFDSRELIDSREYLECKSCGTKYAHSIEKGSPKIHLTILQKAARVDYQEHPQYLG